MCMLHVHSHTNSNSWPYQFAEGTKLKAKEKENLDAKLEATIKANRSKAKQKPGRRINWDSEPHFSLRQRVADAWIKQNDFYVPGDSMYSFCNRTTVSRAVLIRYLPKRRKEIDEGITIPAGKRGRPAHLSESVQRHICEGCNCNLV